MTNTVIIQRLSALALLLVTAVSAFSSTVDTEIHHRILNTGESFEPTVTRGTVLFTYSAPRGAQMVSLAFEHEQYRRFHTYERNRHGVFVLTIPVPEGMDRLRYRVIVDGLWTIDPKAATSLDSRGIRVSSVEIPIESAAPKPGAHPQADGSIKFVFAGQTGSRVSLIGDFNRWDPFLTPMLESPVHPGIYSTVLRLPPESRIYRFVVDGKEIIDPENPVVARNGWGESASRLPQ